MLEWLDWKNAFPKALANLQKEHGVLCHVSAQNEFFKLFFSESSKNIVVLKIVARAQQFQFCMDESEWPMLNDVNKTI